MADNVAITAGTGTTVAADDVGGAMHQRVKATWGPDGTGNDIDVATGKPLPVQLRSATGLIPIGEPTDAKSTATDGTSVTLVSIAKQISASTQATVTAVTAATISSGPAVATIVTPADAQFTRPSDTTAYAIGDLIANNTTAGSVTRLSWTGATKTAAGGTGRIVGFVGRKSGTVAATVRYHFLKTDHAVTGGDNAALVLTSLDVDNYYGYMDVTWGAAELVGSGGESVAKSYDAPLPYVLASGDTIYCVMQALVAFTPANGGTLGGRPIFEVWS